jgi:hypothetical protein
MTDPINWEYEEQFALILNLNRMYGVAFWSSYEAVKTVFPEVKRSDFFRIVENLITNLMTITSTLKERGSIE